METDSRETTESIVNCSRLEARKWFNPWRSHSFTGSTSSTKCTLISLAAEKPPLSLIPVARGHSTSPEIAAYEKDQCF